MKNSTPTLVKSNSKHPAASLETLEPRWMLSHTITIADFYPMVAASTYQYAADDDGSASSVSRSFQAGPDGDGTLMTESIDGIFNATQLFNAAGGNINILERSWANVEDGGTDFQVLEDALRLFPSTMTFGTAYTDSADYTWYHSDTAYGAFVPGPDDVADDADVVGTGTFSVSATATAFEAVTTAAGTFTCVKINYTSTMADDGGSTTTDTYTLWLAPNIGEVKKDLDWTVTGPGAGSGTQTYELGSYIVPGLAARNIHFTSAAAAKYTLADGTRVSIKLIGAGSGDVQFDSMGNVDAKSIFLYDTTYKSNIEMYVTGRSNNTSVDDVTVFGSLKQFNAGKLDLDNSLTVEDSVQFLTLDDATGTITLGDDANIRNTTVKLDEATDLDLNSLTTLKSVSVDFWAGNDHGIAATKIDSLSSQHDFDAGVVVNMGDYHAFDSGTVLGSVSIGRNLTGGSWAVQGNVNKFAVKGTTDDLTFTVAENTTAGNVTEMNFNYITSADVTVDNKITRVSAKHWLAGNLAADSIERLTVSGTQGFGADLMLYGDNVAANDYALKYMTVNSWLGNQAGESTVAVLGKVYNATIGAIKNANFFVGTTSDPDQLSDFDAAHPTIHSLTLNGIKVGASKQYLEDATVAAYGFDKLTFAGRNAVLHTASVKTRASGITKLVNTPATDEADWLVTLV